MSATTHHLPAIVLRADDERAFTLVTACGKRGAIAVRDAAETSQMQFFGTLILCPECLVRWDAAEEAGALRIVWHVPGKRAWAGPGAVVFAAVVRELLAQKACFKCGGPMSHRFDTAEPLAVVVREDRRPKVVRG